MTGGIALRLAAGPAGARLTGLEQRSPWRALFPRPAAGEPITVALANIGGGVLGGDRAEITVAMGEGARAVVTTQAAEKVYRSAGAAAQIDTRLEVGAGAWLDWAPQETILFDGARLDRSLMIDVAAGAQVLAGEMLVYGRTARGERLAKGSLLDRWRVFVGSRLVWAEGLRLDEPITDQLDNMAGFDGAVASATLALIGDGAADHRDAARAMAAEGPSDAAATVVNGVLLLRFLGHDAAQVRAHMLTARGALRHLAAGLPRTAPRLWLV